MNSLRLLLIAGALFSWMTAGLVSASSGVIRFVGAIVESPCMINIIDSTANTECYRNGKNYTGRQKLANFDAKTRSLPLDIGTTEIKWIDKQKNLALLTVVYR